MPKTGKDIQLGYKSWGRVEMEEIKKGINKFYIGDNIENPSAQIIFLPSGENKIIIEHTYVSDSLVGQGIGQQLVKKAAEYARLNNLKIIPECSYARKVMTSSDEYSDILYDD